MAGIFEGMRFYLPACDERKDVANVIKNNGGKLTGAPETGHTFSILTDDLYKVVASTMCANFPRYSVNWVWKSVEAKRLLDKELFRLKPIPTPKKRSTMSALRSRATPNKKPRLSTGQFDPVEDALILYNLSLIHSEGKILQEDSIWKHVRDSMESTSQRTWQDLRDRHLQTLNERTVDEKYQLVNHHLGKDIASIMFPDVDSGVSQAGSFPVNVDLSLESQSQTQRVAVDEEPADTSQLPSQESQSGLGPVEGKEDGEDETLVHVENQEPDIVLDTEQEIEDYVADEDILELSELDTVVECDDPFPGAPSGGETLVAANPVSRLSQVCGVSRFEATRALFVNSGRIMASYAYLKGRPSCHVWSAEQDLLLTAESDSEEPLLELRRQGMKDITHRASFLHSTYTSK